MQLEMFIDLDEFEKEVYQVIDPGNLTEAMSTQTARAAYYSMQSIRAKTQKDKIALDVKKLHAGLTKVMRKKLNDAAVKEAEENNTKPERVTVDMIQAEVTLHPEMRKWEELQIEADEIYAVCKAAYDAFYSRREMLKSIGFMTVEQMRTNLTIRSATETNNKYRERRAAREAGRQTDEG